MKFHPLDIKRFNKNFKDIRLVEIKDFARKVGDNFIINYKQTIQNILSEINKIKDDKYSKNKINKVISNKFKEFKTFYENNLDECFLTFYNAGIASSSTEMKNLSNIESTFKLDQYVFQNTLNNFYKENFNILEEHFQTMIKRFYNIIKIKNDKFSLVQIIIQALEKNDIEFNFIYQSLIKTADLFYNTARYQNFSKNGIDLIKYKNNIISLSGKNKKYISLENAFEKGMFQEDVFKFNMHIEG